MIITIQQIDSQPVLTLGASSIQNIPKVAKILPNLTKKKLKIPRRPKMSPNLRDSQPKQTTHDLQELGSNPLYSTGMEMAAGSGSEAVAFLAMFKRNI